MSSVRVHKPNGMLFFDFRHEGERCREYTMLPDSPANRKKLEKVLSRIESEIADGTFIYANYFPNSKALKRIAKANALVPVAVPGPVASNGVVATDGVIDVREDELKRIEPTFKEFANTWFNERSIEWRRSHIKSLLSTMNGHLIPYFGEKVVSRIPKSEVLEFRATLAKVKGRKNKEGLSHKRINEIMGLLRQIMEEAADRFEFTTPCAKIKKLHEPKVDIFPFNLEQVQGIIYTVRVDYKNYFVTRFFSGMRTGEIHGLKWEYVDFDHRIIKVRETFVLGEDEYTKTDGSQRDIQMSQPVYEALKDQFNVTGNRSKYVFCNLAGEPLDNKNFADRVWYPLLRHLGLKERRPYQMRHTAATLWLASGEAPEWIARQLGHTNTEMLFTTYSRYVPNLTRQDGSAMERLLASKMSQGQLVEQHHGNGDSNYVPVREAAPLPIPKPRGIYGKPSVRGKTDITTIEPIVFTDVPANAKVPEHSPESSSGPADAQPPPEDLPLTWQDLARNWMGDSMQSSQQSLH